MECKVCWKVFRTTKDETEHYNIFKTHENYDSYTRSKPFECKFCKVRFNIEKDLLQHTKIHDKTKSFNEEKVIEETSKDGKALITELSIATMSKTNIDGDICEQTNYLGLQPEAFNRDCTNKSIQINKEKLTHSSEIYQVLSVDKNCKIADSFFDDTTFSQTSDSADVRVVELDAKTIELSSSDDENDLDCRDCEVNRCVEDEEIVKIQQTLTSKIENDIDETNESDDYPLTRLVERQTTNQQINKKNPRSNGTRKELKSKKYGNTSTKTKDCKKIERKNKRMSCYNATLLKFNPPTSELEEVLIVQPDIFIDNYKEPQNIVEQTEESYGNVVSKHRCSTCGERRNNKRLLQQHKQIHNGLGETECKVCNKIFGTPQDVLAHFDSFRKNKTDKHYQEGRPYQCKDCDSRFIHLKHLYEHRKIHIGDKKYACKICGKSFLRKQGLQWHLETHLSEEIDVESLQNLQGIKVRDNIKNKRMFVCDICGHEFKQSSQLKIHINRHVKLKRFSCTVCGKCFVTPRDLLKHSRTHTGERPYKCTFCEKSFIDSGDRIKHERLHTGEKPYTCQNCGKKFTFSSGLRTHERAVHFGLKRYNCDKCTRGFSNKSCLIKHKAKIHLQR